MDDKNSRKKDIGSLSVKYLKFLFLKTRKKYVPELEEDFRDRRYYKDEFEEKEEEIIDVQPVESKILPELKDYIFHRLEEEDYKEQDVDNFIEKNTARESNRRRNRRAKKDYDDEDDLDFLENNNDNFFDEEEYDFLEKLENISSNRKETSSISKRKSNGLEDSNDDLDDFLKKYK